MEKQRKKLYNISLTKSMNILFLGYWGVNEGLSEATIFPHLKILSQFQNIEKIIYCSIERGNYTPIDLKINKVIHTPLFSKKYPIPLLDKVLDFKNFPNDIVNIIKKHNIDELICRGAPAGALGYLVWKKTKIPFTVESFEPHADYMHESGVWKKYDPRYIFEKKWEEKQKIHAKAIITVSNNYKTELVQKEHLQENKIFVGPCCVPLEDFKYNSIYRNEIREKLNITPEQTVAIYVGKFGGIYYDKEAFDLFSKSFDIFPSFYLIILTPQEGISIENKLLKRGIRKDNFYINLIPHSEIPKFLSASDFAFSTIKEAPIRKFCSPIKDGEYWANGLPILIPNGIGDDSEIIKKEGGGVILDLSDMSSSLIKMKNYIDNHSRIVAKNISHTHRNFTMIEQIYKKLFS